MWQERQRCSRGALPDKMRSIATGWTGSEVGPMRVLPVFLLVLWVWSAALVGGAAAQQETATLWAALRAGGHVALVRHAGGAGDPPGFRLDDCATQRNLTDKGRAEARRLGEQFRSEDVVVGKLMSSQWCRCQETAALMDLGPVELTSTFNNAFTLRDRVGTLTAGARAVVAGWTQPDTLVVVTHGANILPLTGEMPEEGGMVIVKPDPGSAAKLRTLGHISPLPLGP
jgi:phosphohistidine phosphatase SixA